MTENIESKAATAAPGQNLTTLILMVGQIVNHKKAIAMAVMNGDGEVYEEYKASLAAFERDLDWQSILDNLNTLDQLSQPLPTLTTGKEVEQLEAISGRPIRVSAEFLAMLFRRALVARQLCSLPAGTYILRKKYDYEDSWDVQIEGQDCESAFSLELHEAASALLRDAIEKTTREAECARLNAEAR